MKNDRSGKKISTLNVKKKFGQSDGQFGQFCRPGQFFFGFLGVNIPKVKNPGKCHDLERKCKFLTQEWAGGIYLGFLM